MKTRIGIMILAMLFGCSEFVWATGEVFPVEVAATYAGENSNTMVKAEGNELRISTGPIGGESTQDYLVDVAQGTIAQSPGEMVTKGGEGWQSAYDAVIASLGSTQSGLAGLGDTVNAEAVGSTITYLQAWVAA